MDEVKEHKGTNPIKVVNVVADADEAYKREQAQEMVETAELAQKGVDAIKKAKASKPFILRRKRGMSHIHKGENFVSLVQDAEASWNSAMNIYNVALNEPVEEGF